MKRFIGCLAVVAGMLAGGTWLANGAGPAASAPASQASTQAGSLVTNGDFSAATKDPAWPDGWAHPKDATWEKEGDTHFIRLKSSEPGETVLLYRAIPLPKPAPAALEIRLKVRYSDVKVGTKKWFDARVMGHFKDAVDGTGKTLQPDPSPAIFKGTSKGWVEKTYYVKVPAGARELELMPCIFQAASGTLDLASMEVYPASADKLPKPPPIIPSALMPLPGGAAGKLPAELHVDGNQLKTPDGKAVWLQGLCLDSLEWADAGEHLDKSVPEAIEVWHANVIRLPMSGKFWFGRPAHNQKPRDGGVKYRKVIDSVVAATETRGAYLVLDLHSFGHPTAEDVEFWKDAATRYKDNPGVLFELFNEPHDLSWHAWRYGGNVKDKGATDAKGVVKENKEVQTGDTTVGMQALVNAVRSTGAKNIVIAGGLAWGFDLSGVLKGYALNDDGGNGIMYSSHLYPWKIGYQKSTLDAAAKYPIFVGEVGCPQKWSDFKFIPKAEQYVDLSKNEWQPDVLGMFQKYHLNWTGFSFHPHCGPPVIKDWDYTPTDYWGVYVKDALAGKRYEMKRVR